MKTRLAIGKTEHDPAESEQRHNSGLKRGKEKLNTLAKRQSIYKKWRQEAAIAERQEGLGG
jgi:hypothetical protein